MCDDCQSYAHYLNHPERILDPNGGTELYPVPQSYLKITTGKEHLQCLRLTSKGTYRWYAGCCNTPVANSGGAKVPFVGVVHSIMRHGLDKQSRDELLGPIDTRVMAKYGKPPFPENTADTFSWSAIWRSTLFALITFLKRQAEPSPFYTKDGKPVVRPYILAKAENETVHSLAAQT